MPIIQHPACTEPAPDASICRFMDFHKFRDLFANEELYFRRTDLFKETDPSEALPSDEYVRAACGLRKYDLDDERALNNNQAFARQNSEAYFISCWQLFEGETLDMWKTYGNGVAVFSRMNLDHPAHASSSGNPIVTVGNTSANPVPTVTQGTSAVSGNVSITGTPNVNVSWSCL